MKKITAKYEFASNYIFHLLSVSNVMYNNNYSKQNKRIHNDKDLIILKNNEQYISVSGGEHCGKLFGIYVSVPSAYFSDDEKELQIYYSFLHKIFSRKDVKPEDIKKYNNLFMSLGFSINFADDPSNFYSEEELKAASSIARVFQDNIKKYKASLWDINKSKKNKMLDKMNVILNSVSISLLEDLIGTKYSNSEFVALMVNSIENGPQAIDVSGNKDVFFLDRNIVNNTDLLTHELIIFILRDAGIKMNDFSQYKIIESLAGFYNKKYLGRIPQCWYGESKYIEIFEKIYEDKISAYDLFNKFNLTTAST